MYKSIFYILVVLSLTGSGSGRYKANREARWLSYLSDKVRKYLFSEIFFLITLVNVHSGKVESLFVLFCVSVNENDYLVVHRIL